MITKRKLVIILCAAIPLGWSQTPQQVASPNATAHALTPGEKMPSPPRVSFSQGQLTVIADNSSMQEVLDAIHGATGSQFDVQRGSGDNRVFGKFGPGPVSKVVGDLLKGGGISYILVSSPANPGGLQRAMLMGKAVAPPPITAQPPQAAQNNNNVEDDNGGVDPSQYETEDGAAQAEASQQQQQQQQLQQQQGVVVNGAIGIPPNNGAKTPEQLLQELQQIRQQQIQQIQQQRGGMPAPTAATPQ